MAAGQALAGLRETDRDRYLTLLYAPADKRNALACLYAFDGEISTLRNRVRDALPGELRIRWWQDTIESGSAAHATGNPLADELATVIERYDLPRDAFANYLEAHVFDVYNDPMPSRTDLEGYCGETAGAIIQLACLILEQKAASRAADAAGHAGCTIGMTALLRALPAHRARGQCFFPADMLQAAGTTPDAFAAGEAGAAIPIAIDAMMALSRDHLSSFQIAAKSLPASLRPAFLPIEITTLQLAKIRKSAPAVDGFADVSPLRKQSVVMWRAMRGW